MGKSFTTISTEPEKVTIDTSEKDRHYKFIHDTIRLCATLGVTEFSAGGVSVKFRSDKLPVETISPTVDSTPQTLEQVTPIDQSLLQDFHRAQGLLDDPYGYEDEIVREQLRFGATDGRVEETHDY